MMLSFKRFYIALVLLLFIAFSFFYFFSMGNEAKVYPLKASNQEIKQIKIFVSQYLSSLYPENISVYKLDLSKSDHKILELDENNISKATIVAPKFPNFFYQNWIKWRPKDQVKLNTKPYFTIDHKLSSDHIYLIINDTGLIHSDISLKLFNEKDFLNEKNYYVIIQMLTLFILSVIVLAAFFVFMRIKNGYSLFFLAYSILCICSSLLYNGFTNDFWPFNQASFSAHSLGLGIGVHLLALCLFCYFYLRRLSSKIIFQHIALAFSIFSFLLFGFSFYFESYYIVKYEIFNSLLISCTLLLFYPSIFRNYKEKEAYQYNYLSILSYVLLSLIFTFKYLNVINTSILSEILQKVFFLSHVFCMFFAFILINKRQLLNGYVNYVVSEKELLQLEEDNALFDDKLLNLSDREYEVLKLIAKGMKDQEIADYLFVSLSTTKTHKQRIFKKLNINNRAQAVKIYTEFNSKVFEFSSN